LSLAVLIGLICSTRASAEDRCGGVLMATRTTVMKDRKEMVQKLGFYAIDGGLVMDGKSTCTSIRIEQKRNTMPGNPREMIMLAERRFPVRVRIGVPPEGLSQRHTQITAWLDENCGADGWAMTPSGTRGVLNDALSIYFGNAPANAFVARWCAGYSVETAGGVFQIREDELASRVGSGLHRTP
jgi:hypothetical protein